jgi:uncharacterized protein (TIGR02569 family)
MAAAEARWGAGVLAVLPGRWDFRVARPVQAETGDWIHDGWEAWEHLPGRTDPTRWNAALDAGIAFHRSLAGIARPEFLDERDNPWTRADRIAWGDSDAADDPVLVTLMELRRPVRTDAQLVHGDLLGNVLYASGLPPAIIDWSAYWRPTGWAAAVIAVDAMCWHGADTGLADRWSWIPDWEQVLLRALLFRMLTDQEFARARGRGLDVHTAYLPVANDVISRAQAASAVC